MKLAAALALPLVLLGGCALVEYSDALVDESTGRTNFVTQPASVGGIIGFTLGVPLDVVALPVTYVVYTAQKDEEEEGIDPLSTLLFPSFVLWRAGVLVLGTPLDVIEFAFYRAWLDPPARQRSDVDEAEDRPAQDRRGEG